MAELGIGEVARRAGLKASALRYYEAEGLIPRAPQRSGRRVYDESILDRLRIIQLAKSAGFTMAEIKRLLSGFSRRTAPGQRWRALAETEARRARRTDRRGPAHAARARRRHPLRLPELRRLRARPRRVTPPGGSP